MNNRILMTKEDIERAVQRIGLQILEDHHNPQRLGIVGIYTCGVSVARCLRAFIEKTIGMPVERGSLDINLYRDDWSLVSQNPVVKTTDILFDVNGKEIVLVDDVIFTGRTIRAALDAIMDFGRPANIQLAALIDRGGRELPIQPDYCGQKVSVPEGSKINVIMNTSDDGHVASGEVVIED
ncbi:bifunctional pyr operon transcriptional regulator/uracil phosphoribosyltransferase PyrR [Desulforhopalus vacuolatus]|uniref:bifunctional pyr operon transcriptional regulator/uracil phosphoribosyltransferase PyrR n=1 Tax=Desulforhopalus vacuolatus TaxID=40414 RepID=UPI0019650652|nr:bifunctional pyr operon transcriptional regulator/uracil phosphoribosyltransferase PyrR [Desulforhopalus vacuolatus]MBM9520490.1 bifunctional pyr operon transcriptional regulator/uracil phosphoribosyltransferase PyrR [Desulforhopalus vacuolatus]